MEQEPQKVDKEGSPEDEAVSVLSVEISNLQLALTKLREGIAKDMSDADAAKLRGAVEALTEAVGDIEYIIENSR